MRKFIGIGAVILALSGCASFPELDAAVTDTAKKADYPSLIPAESLLNRRNEGRLDETDGAALLARAAHLRARGRILRNLATIDDATRQRIAARLRRLGG